MKYLKLNSVAGTLAVGLGLLCTPAVYAAAPSPLRLPPSLAGIGRNVTSGPTKSIGHQVVQNAIGFNFTSIVVPAPTAEANTTNAFSISNNGVFVGYYAEPEFVRYTGYISNGRFLTKLNYPGSNYTFCYAVNNSGKVVGQYLDANFVSFAFTYQNGVYTTLAPVGAGGAVTSGGAFGINDLGDIAGFFSDSLGQHGFIFKNATSSYTVVDVPGMVNVIAFGINNQGVVTVQATVGDPAVTSSYVYRNGTLTLLNVPGALSSYIHGLNDAGYITYSYQTVAGGPFLAKLYAQGKFLDANYPGSTSTYADAINNSNVVAGNAAFPDLSYSGFYATPTR